MCETSAVRRGGRPGYQIWAAGDRCREDYFLRDAERSLARAIAQGCAEWVITAARERVERNRAAVRDWEARFQLGGPAR